MPASFTIKKGDTLPVLTATLYSDNSMRNPVDLTSASSARLLVGKPGTTPVINVAMSFVSPRSSGKVEYEWTPGDTDVSPDTYRLEVEVTWNDGNVGTYPKKGYLTFTVVDDLSD